MSHTENDMIMGEGLAKKGINERKRRIGKENVKNSDKKIFDIVKAQVNA